MQHTKAGRQVEGTGDVQHRHEDGLRERAMYGVGRDGGTGR